MTIQLDKIINLLSNQIKVIINKTENKGEKIRKVGIGIHCTDGITRTGFLIINYLMKNEYMSLKSAFNIFETSRYPHRFRNPKLVDWLIEKFDERQDFSHPLLIPKKESI